MIPPGFVVRWCRWRLRCSTPSRSGAPSRYRRVVPRLEALRQELRHVTTPFLDVSWCRPLLSTPDRRSFQRGVPQSEGYRCVRASDQGRRTHRPAAGDRRQRHPGEASSSRWMVCSSGSRRFPRRCGRSCLGRVGHGEAREACLDGLYRGLLRSVSCRDGSSGSLERFFSLELASIRPPSAADFVIEFRGSLRTYFYHFFSGDGAWICRTELLMLR